MPLNCIKFCAYFITIKTIEKQKIKLIFKIDAYCLDLKQYLFFIFYTSVERPCWISPWSTGKAFIPVKSFIMLRMLFHLSAKIDLHANLGLGKKWHQRPFLTANSSVSILSSKLVSPPTIPWNFLELLQHTLVTVFFPVSELQQHLCLLCGS